MRVRDMMTTKVFTVREEHTLELVEDIMEWQRVRHVPVTDSAGTLVGLMTHRDLIRAAVSSIARISRQEQRELYRGIRVGAKS